MSVERARKRLDAPADAVGAVAGNGFRELPGSILHAQEVDRLLLHHADPFDRILIAEARIEGLTIVTLDRVFEACGIPR